MTTMTGQQLKDFRRRQRESHAGDVYVTIETTREHSDGGYQMRGEARVYLRDCCVGADGEVRAHDPIAGHYSRHHDLTESEVAEARRLAGR